MFGRYIKYVFTSEWKQTEWEFGLRKLRSDSTFPLWSYLRFLNSFSFPRRKQNEMKHQPPLPTPRTWIHSSAPSRAYSCCAAPARGFGGDMERRHWQEMSYWEAWWFPNHLRARFTAEAISLMNELAAARAGPLPKTLWRWMTFRCILCNWQAILSWWLPWVHLF